MPATMQRKRIASGGITVARTSGEFPADMSALPSMINRPRTLLLENDFPGRRRERPESRQNGLLSLQAGAGREIFGKAEGCAGRKSLACHGHQSSLSLMSNVSNGGSLTTSSPLPLPLG